MSSYLLVDIISLHLLIYDNLLSQDLLKGLYKRICDFNSDKDFLGLDLCIGS